MLLLLLGVIIGKNGGVFGVLRLTLKMMMMMIKSDMMVKMMGFRNGFSEFFDDNFGFRITVGIPTETVVEKTKVFVEEFKHV